MNKVEIQKKYLTQHDALGKQKDAPDKAKFDQEHRAIWHAYDVELSGRKAELEARGNLSDNEQKELRELIELCGG